MESQKTTKGPLEELGEEKFYLKYSDYVLRLNKKTIIDFVKTSDVNKSEFYDMIIEKEKTFIANLKPNSLNKEAPTREEIRDAMMEECENYYILEGPCKAAVEIAYWLD